MVHVSFMNNNRRVISFYTVVLVEGESHLLAVSYNEKYFSFMVNTPENQGKMARYSWFVGNK